MIKVGENYLGDVVRAAWKVFKIKFPEKIKKITNQDNNILNFCYAIHKILTAKDVNIGLDLRQREAMRDLEQL